MAAASETDKRVRRRRGRRRIRRPGSPASVAATAMSLALALASGAAARTAGGLRSASASARRRRPAPASPAFAPPLGRGIVDRFAAPPPPASRLSSSSSSSDRSRDAAAYDADVESALLASGYRRPSVNWYPGHIAKAERMLSETLKSVDVVIEVRDARIPKATAHPRVAEWSAGRPRVVVLTHADGVTAASRAAWARAFEEYGAGRWDGEVDGQVRNRALQAWRERGRWRDDAADESLSSSKGGDRKQGPTADGLASRVEAALFVDARRGSGIRAINRAVLRAGTHVNERRMRRGLNERPLRVGVMGYPNVGKSALINRILGRRRARTADTPGVTRSLQWIRVRTDDAKRKGREFELLDSPGIIPANMIDQSDALLLAACNSVGNAAYDNQAVAAYLCEWLKTLHLMGHGTLTSPRWRDECRNRYGFDPLEPQPVSVIGGLPGDDAAAMRVPTGEDALFMVADNKCRGDPEDASRKILQDFRSGRMGPISLQLAPRVGDDEGGQRRVELSAEVAALAAGPGGDLEEARREVERRRRREAEERGERARAAVETARRRGLDLPPVAAAAAADPASDESKKGEAAEGEEKEAAPVADEEVGKGMFDGW